MATEETCRICYGPGEYFCILCSHSYFCKQHVCAHIGKVDDTDDPPPTYGKMTREDFDRYTFQKFKDKTDDEEKAEEKQDTRKFWLFCIPVSLVAAFALTVATNMGTAGFFFAWLIFAVLVYSFVSKRG